MGLGYCYKILYFSVNSLKLNSQNFLYYEYQETDAIAWLVYPAFSHPQEVGNLRDTLQTPEDAFPMKDWCSFRILGTNTLYKIYLKIPRLYKLDQKLYKLDQNDNVSTRYSTDHSSTIYHIHIIKLGESRDLDFLNGLPCFSNSGGFTCFHRLVAQGTIVVDYVES